jgi:hypothetical protein
MTTYSYVLTQNERSDHLTAVADLKTQEAVGNQPEGHEGYQAQREVWIWLSGVVPSN